MDSKASSLCFLDNFLLMQQDLLNSRMEKAILINERQNTKRNLGAQKSWVDFCTHKCDQDPLRTTLLTSSRWSTMVVLNCSAQGQKMIFPYVHTVKQILESRKHLLIQKPGNTCLRNPESYSLESGIQVEESGVPKN